MNTLRTPILNDTVQKLLRRNNEEHFIFFDGSKHNHFPHVILSDYALGATDSQLNKQWEYESYLEPKKKEFSEEISVHTVSSHLGDAKYYSNYLDFFKKEIEVIGRNEVLIKYLFKDELFPHAFSGIVHPLIHIGFGIEFESNDVLAEGLAMMCTQKDSISKMLSFLKEKNNSFKYSAILPFFEEIRNDKSIDEILPGTSDNKLKITFEKLQDKISNCASLFQMDDWSDESAILVYLSIVVEAAIHLYSTTIFNPSLADVKDIDYAKASEIVKPDFFLLHGLTSALSLLEIVPHLSNEQALKVIRSHFATLIFLFISRGRPPFNFDAIKNYPIPQKITGWKDILAFSCESSDEHTAKVVRSLIIGNKFLSSKKIPTCGMVNVDDLDNNTDSLIFRAAAMTVDWMVIKKKKWEFDGCGFKETWSKEEEENKNKK